MMPPREFLMPAQVLIGSGAVEQTGTLCQKRGWKKALIVSDKIMLSLGLVGKAFQERLTALDAFLDLIDETLEGWAKEAGA